MVALSLNSCKHDMWMFFGFFLTKDMQILLSFAPISMKDAQCAESNEKINFSIYRENSMKTGSSEYKFENF